ncbi:MAG: hypothetical protein II394_09560, partial [Bacteroidales bacterium]|nr:hypothetical protein [Bacteroidales bacterium]
RDDDMAGVCGEKITAMLFAPRPKVVKNLKGVKLGKKHDVRFVGMRSRIAVSAMLPVPYRVL